MNNLDLLTKRTIALYLNAFDKIRRLALVSKQWNQLVYSGFAWQVLFDGQHDPTWNISKLSRRIFQMFKHFKGVKILCLYQRSFSIKHLREHVSDIQRIHYICPRYLNPQSRRFEDVVQLNFYKEVLSKLVDRQRWSIPRLHVLTALGKLQDSMHGDEKDKADTIEGLIKSGHDVNEIDSYNLTPIYYAIRFNENPKVVQYLLSKGANLQKAEFFGQNILHISAKTSKSVDVFKLLLQYWPGKIEQAIDANKKHLVHSAVMNQNLTILKFLLEIGASIKAKDKFARQPIHYAAKNSNLKLFKFLIQNGASSQATDKHNTTTAHFAAQNQNSQIFLYLFNKKNLLVNTRNKKNQTLLHFAAMNQNSQTIKFLLKQKGLQLNPRHMSTLQTPLHYAAKNKNPELFRLLVEKGASLEAQDSNKDRPVHYAARNENSDILRYLAQIKADLDPKNQRKQTPFYHAGKCGNKQNLRILVQYGITDFEKHFCGRNSIICHGKNKTIDQIMKLLNS